MKGVVRHSFQFLRQRSHGPFVIKLSLEGTTSDRERRHLLLEKSFTWLEHRQYHTLLIRHVFFLSSLSIEVSKGFYYVNQDVLNKYIDIKKIRGQEKRL